MLRNKQQIRLVLLLGVSTVGMRAEVLGSVHLTEFLKTGLVVDAEVNGRTGTFLFDTGVGGTNLTPQFAAAIGCKPWGQISGFSMMGHRLDMPRCENVHLRLGRFDTQMQTVGVFDSDQMMPPGAPKLDGAIGLDAFVKYTVVFSYSSKTLRILDSGDVPQTGGMSVHLQRDGGGLALMVNLPVITPRGTAWFALDSGNVTPMTAIAKPYAEAFGLDANAKSLQKVDLRFPDGSTFTADAKVMDVTLDGNIGVSFLAKYDVTLDLAHLRAWITRAEGSVKP